jgi:hypothetical protein
MTRSICKHLLVPLAFLGLASQLTAAPLPGGTTVLSAFEDGGAKEVRFELSGPYHYEALINAEVVDGGNGTRSPLAIFEMGRGTFSSASPILAGEAIPVPGHNGILGEDIDFSDPEVMGWIATGGGGTLRISGALAEPGQYYIFVGADTAETPGNFARIEFTLTLTSVPDSGSSMSLIGFGLFALAVFSRSSRFHLALKSYRHLA